MSDNGKTIGIPCARKECLYSIDDRCIAPGIVFKAYGRCERIIEPKKELTLHSKRWDDTKEEWVKI